MTKDITPDFNKVTEVELVYYNKIRPSSRTLIKDSKSVYDLFLKSWDMGKIDIQEQFKIMLLDRKNSCLGISTISTGGFSACVADPKIIFAIALKSGASSIILAHNHPSGNLKPSEADKNITARFSYAGNILEIPVLDHIVLTSEGYTSFADEGMLSNESRKVVSWQQLVSPHSPS